MKRLLLLSPLVLSFACDENLTSNDPTVEVAIAPLTLPGVTNVCYTLEVRNEANQPVWRQTDICADQYGDLDSDITYIGTCDATDTNLDTVANNTVTVTIEEIWAGGASQVPDADWVNPCSYFADGTTQVSPNGDSNGPCKRSFPCVANRDTFVDFNLTIMRSANQGFFDIAVNFEDIFCSAKVDCIYTNNDRIRLLHNPNKNNGRDDTIVIGRACSAGVGANTQLHTSGTVISCGEMRTNGYHEGVWFAIKPIGPDGNPNRDNVATGFGSLLGRGTMTLGGYTAAPLSVITWQNANYSGAELLSEGNSSLGKIYLNQAIGFDFKALEDWWGSARLDGLPEGTLLSAAVQLQGCSLLTSFTATDGGFPKASSGLDVYPRATTIKGGTTPTSLTLWQNDTSLTGNLICTRHGLDTTGATGLFTEYGNLQTMSENHPLCVTSDGPSKPLKVCPLPAPPPA